MTKRREQLTLPWFPEDNDKRPRTRNVPIPEIQAAHFRQRHDFLGARGQSKDQGWLTAFGYPPEEIPSPSGIATACINATRYKSLPRMLNRRPRGHPRDRKSVVRGKSVSVRVALGGRSI